MRRATAEGTARFRDASAAASGHFRSALGGLVLSSIGLGTYLGRDDAATDALYVQAANRAAALGVNVFDSAINYRNQRSERALGEALATLDRESVVVCTKGGFLPFDGARPPDPRAYLDETFVRPGLLRWDEIVQGCHSMAPRFLSDQIDRSRRNLGVECIDLYYLHNPETQLGEVPRAEFLRRLRAAFEALERACADGRIGVYGAATWSGFRIEADEDEHLAFDEVLACAREVAGERHHFRAVQLPFNLEMDEAGHLRNQGGRTLLDAAAGAGVAVFASASVLQGKLASAPPSPALPGGATLTGAQRALHFVRSTPGVACALVGMKTRAHVEENAALSRVSPVS